jgi:SAM-dependent methyltransferase
MTVATAKAVVADRSPGDEDFGHFRCKACGVTDGHDPNCPVYDCPHCGVSPDDAVLHGHDPGCPNDARRRDEHPPVNPDVGDIDTAGLLDDTYKFLNRFLVVNAAALVAGALFTGHTYAFAAAETTPRLSIRSPEAESGKSRWLEALEHVVRRGWYLIEPSIAALYRVTEKERRSILFDEIDTMLGPAAHNAEDVRAFLNAGYRKGAKVPRCVGEGSKMTVKDFDVFAPVVVAGIGKLPPTTETRSIVVHMKPRTKGEPVERLRIRKVRPIGEALRARWAAWAEAHTEELTEAEPDLPDELSDRMQDVWEPLLAIADLAGEGWAARARAAAQELFESRDQDDESIGRRLLADIRAVLDDPERDDPDDDTHGQAIASGALATALAAIEGAPWAEWSRDDKPISATKVAWMLRPFGIRPGQHKISGRKIRGYLRSNFEDAWRRHLKDDREPDPDPPPSGESGTSDKVVPANPNKGNGGTTSPSVPPLPGGGDGSGWEPRSAGSEVENAEQQPPDEPVEDWEAPLRAAITDEPEFAQLTIGGKAEPIDAKGTPARGPKHPAEFSAEIIPFLAAAAPPGEYPRVLDPMAGKGGIHKLANLTIGVKLEPEWAFARPGTIKGNAFYLPFRDESFDAIVTSPTYGNRYADDFIPSEESKSKWTWRSYTLDLGRKLHPDNTGQLHWGPKYRADHLKAWTEAVRVLRPGGRFVLNISDHIRNHERQYVTDWHVEALTRLGLREIARKPVPTKRMRYGTNAEARVDAEHVITFEKEGLARDAEHPGQEYLDAAFGSADPKRFTR